LGEGRYPSIIADDPNIEVYVNSKKAQGAIVVTEKDSIEFNPKMVEPCTRIEVSLSKNKLEAFLSIEKIPGEKYFVKDVKSSNCVFILSDYSEIPPVDVAYEECISALERKNIDLQFVSRKAVEKLISLPEGGTDIVAEGIPPVGGLNSKVKYLFQNSSYLNPDFNTHDKINLLDHTIIPSVNIGDVLAIKSMPAVPGKDGITVTGEKIKAREGRDVPLKAGRGAMVLDNGFKVVASSAGRPVMQSGVISVMPVLIIPYDVDPSTGNINYDGDIVVRGNIQDNMKVTADSNITVLGNIFNASVSAGGNIYVFGNIIGSKITAGTSAANLLCVVPKVEKIIFILKEVYDKLTHIQPEKQKELIHEFISEDENLNKLVKEIKSLTPLLSNEEVNSIKKTIKELQLLLVRIKVLHLQENIEQIETLYNKLKQYADAIKNIYGKKANITFNYSQRSHIQANGNIVITGKGCYQTKLIAKNAIVFKDMGSSVLGGMLVAGKTIKMGIVGSPAGISTYCRVFEKGGRIDAVRYFSNTVLNINNKLTVIGNDP
jgi:uncharacterized protein (DUF342 family)